MSTPSSLPSSPIQAPDTEPVNLNPEAAGAGHEIFGNSPPGTPRERKARNRVIRLSAMPPFLSPKSVARWIFDYPDEQRGGIRGLAA